MGERIFVLGAGLQGACTALELARRGAAVTLVDQDQTALQRASLRNEGKIHLGFVYAQSKELETTRLMMRGALSFRRLLAGWTRGRLARMRVSTPFHYWAVEDSLLSPAELEEHYAAVEQVYRESEGDYLGRRPERLWWRIPRSALLAGVQAGYGAEELSIDTAELAAALGEAVRADPRIELCYGVRVEGVERRPAGFRVHGVRNGATWTGRAGQVVNALWEGRLAVDASMGGLPSRPWVNRLKHRVLAELPESLRGLASMTFVLGAYGDIVTRTDHSPAYVSWYPECMSGWSGDAAPPAEWDAACRGALPLEAQLELGRRALKGFERLVPGLAQARVRTVDAGVIFAWGDRDITERGSELHRRDEIGVESRDGYHTVNTGKLTTAPLFAVEAADRVFAA